jgi:drug/metabolite transporter (DMT)-like permease
MTRRGRATSLRMGLLALLWGSGYLWIKLSLDAGMAPVQVTFTRCVFATATLLAISNRGRHRLPRDRATWGHLIIAAFFCNALPFMLFSIGEQSVGSGIAGVLNATTALWSFLLGIALGSERRLRPVRFAGLLLGFTGTAVIFAPWQAGGLAGWRPLVILGAAVSYAIAFTYMARTLTGKGTAPIALSAAQMLAATGISALALPVGGLRFAHIRPEALATVAILGIFATGVTFYLNYRLIADEGATTAATVGYLLPIVSVLLGAIIVHEHVTVMIILGMGLTLIGVAMTRRGGPAPPAPSPREGSPEQAAPAQEPLRKS